MQHATYSVLESTTIHLKITMLMSSPFKEGTSHGRCNRTLCARCQVVMPGTMLYPGTKLYVLASRTTLTRARRCLHEAALRQHRLQRNPAFARGYSQRINVCSLCPLSEAELETAPRPQALELLLPGALQLSRRNTSCVTHAVRRRDLRKNERRICSSSSFLCTCGECAACLLAVVNK
jgi:hypothetical protein